MKLEKLTKSFNYVSPSITSANFPDTGRLEKNCKVVPFSNGETPEEASKRLVKAGYTLANIYELAQFMNDKSEEIDKWNWVLAIDKNSRWTYSDGCVCVPHAYVRGARRYFCLHAFRDRLYSDCGVLVLLGESSKGMYNSAIGEGGKTPTITSICSDGTDIYGLGEDNKVYRWNELEAEWVLYLNN